MSNFSYTCDTLSWTAKKCDLIRSRRSGLKALTDTNFRILSYCSLVLITISSSEIQSFEISAFMVGSVDRTSSPIPICVLILPYPSCYVCVCVCVCVCVYAQCVWVCVCVCVCACVFSRFTTEHADRSTCLDPEKERPLSWEWWARYWRGFQRRSVLRGHTFRGGSTTRHSSG